MKPLFTLIITLIFSVSFAQEFETNLDFEIQEKQKAKGWSDFGKGDYSIAYDTTIFKNGSVSASIASENSESEYKALSFSFPAEFGGKKVKLTGYLKTENVKGWAGLWMRVDPGVSFENMQSRNINGTNDWKKYEIELDLKDRAKQVVVGGILAGEGKIWIDNLEVTVDGLSLENAPEKTLSKAQMDKEFDNGSNISSSDLNSDSIKDLEILGRIWGFLKYHHPSIAKGNYNWDYELFRFLPEYVKAKSDEERDNKILNWIEKLPQIDKCNSCSKTNEDAFLKPDLEWIENNGLIKNLKDKLYYIQQNRNQGEHYYIGMSYNVGNPEFKNENPYRNMPYPDAGFRLLALYRYWNMIHYYFPYKHLTDKDWNTVLKEYIPSFISAKDELAYEKAMIKVIGDVKDTHANLWGGRDKFQEEVGKNYPPVSTRFIENQLTVVDYYDSGLKETVGLRIGDVITHINNKPVKDIVKEIRDYYPASNNPTRLRDIGFDILRSNDKNLEVTVKNKSGISKKIIPLYNQKKLKGYYRWYRDEKNGKSYKMLNNNIGYVTLKNIKEEDVPLLMEEFKNTKGIIIDIRNYPSAFMPFKLAPYFVSKDTPFVKFTSGNINNPGEFTFGSNLSVPSNGKTYKGKVIVIVDEISQSQAEYTSMSFRAGDNVTVIGSTTAGADGNVSQIPLPGGMRTMISGIGVYYPDGTETQRVGIVPDIEIKPTINGIRNRKDEVLEKALDLINSNITIEKKIKD